MGGFEFWPFIADDILVSLAYVSCEIPPRPSVGQKVAEPYLNLRSA